VNERVVRLLGLGLERREVAARDAVHCVVLAGDASVRTLEKVARLARARGVPIVQGPGATALGAGLGRAPVQAVGVQDGALARGLVRSLEE
jgi:ribosomal protein L7Ae-like RNA K-turn-binding protein